MNNYIAIAIVLVITVSIGLSVFMGSGNNSVQGGVQSVISDTVTQMQSVNTTP